MDIRTISLLWQLLGLVAAKWPFSGNSNHFGDQTMLRPLSIYTSLKWMEQPMFPWPFLCVFTWLNLFETLMISYFTCQTQLQFHNFPSRDIFSILCEIENVICLSAFLLLDSPGLSEVWTSNSGLCLTLHFLWMHISFLFSKLSDVVLIFIIYRVFSGNQS